MKKRLSFSFLFNHPRLAKSSLIITAILLVVMSSFTLFMQRRMQEITYLQDGDANFAARPIAQLQRELLQYTILLETSAPSAELELQSDLTESRINVLERHLSNELIPAEIIEQFFYLGDHWRSTEPLRQPIEANIADDAIRDELLTHLNEMELAANQLLREYNSWYGMVSSQLTRSYSFMFLVSQMIAMFFVALSGLVIHNLFRSSAEIQSKQARLLESEERYQLATQAGKVGIWEYRYKQDDLILDPQLAAMLGFQSANVPAATLLQQVKGDGHAKLVEHNRQLFSGEVQEFEDEIEIETKTLGVRWYLLRGRVSEGDTLSHSLLLTGTATDISERKETEAAALEAQRLESLGVLVGGIAHDFNNFMTGIMSQQSVAIWKLKDDTKIKPHLQKAQVSAERAATLTRQLLDYAGKAQRITEVIDLNQLLNDNRELFNTFIDRRTELRFNQSSRPLLVEGDTGQLQQIVMNLVINAAEATSGANSSVTVCTDLLPNGAYHQLRQGDFITDAPQAIPYVQFTVQDTGVGMSAETIRRIFAPFFTTKTHGRGLGISATMGIIKSHGGVLHLHSEEGVGTCFTVLLPLAEDQMATDEPESDEWVIHAKLQKVLVIDDERDVRDSITDLLDLMGVDALTAENGRAGIECYEQHRDDISLVIVDMQMPVMDGAETILRLKQINPSAKIILSSGYSETSSLDRLIEERPNAFLQKPYVIDKFFATIDSVLAT